MRSLLILSILSFFLNNLVAQNSHEKCGHTLLMTQMENKHPGYANVVHESFENIHSKIDSRKSRNDYTIKTVVHIVYSNDAENISEERIERVLAQLNEDYSGDLSISNGLRSEYHSIAGTSNIRFELDEIRRVETDTIFEVDLFSESLVDHVKLTDFGGSDAKNTEEFLNIWVCDIQFSLGDLFGYAYPPTCAENWPDGSSAPESRFDGLVIDYAVFNTDTTFQSATGETLNVEGRTVTHEVGHYLGLRHIWGDGQGAIFGIPDCVADDGIDDTPNQGLPSESMCDLSKNTCTDNVDDLPDMIENYMDYADESCQNTFTVEQFAVMISSIDNCRTGILSSQTETFRPDINCTILGNPSYNGQDLQIDLDKMRYVNISIRDINGNKHSNMALRTNSYTLKTRSFNSGMYLLNISDLETGANYSRKILIVN